MVTTLKLTLLPPEPKKFGSSKIPTKHFFHIHARCLALCSLLDSHKNVKFFIFC
jgi:hypothetical protein